MAKPGFTLETCGGCLRSGSSNNGWALCIGAGASDPVFPRWGKLVEDLLKWSDETLTSAQIIELMKAVSLESLIQAVFHKAALAPYAAAQVLSSNLYNNLKKQTTVAQWQMLERVLSDVNLGVQSDKDAAEILGILATKFPNSTPVQLAETLCRAIESELPPAAILSFNAEPLLLAATNAYLRCNTELPKRKFFDASLRGISYRKQGRIPFHFCHGLLPLPGQSPRRASASLDKLVFQESEYLAIAGSSYTWQSAVFLSTALSNSMVFVGLSFSDPNLRRWLGFVHANRAEELRRIGASASSSTRHYWINKTPTTAQEREMIEAATAHLGVRLVWIEDWSQTRAALRRMLSLD